MQRGSRLPYRLSVAQASKSAGSRVPKPAWGVPIWKSAARQVWKPAARNGDSFGLKRYRPMKHAFELSLLMIEALNLGLWSVFLAFLRRIAVTVFP